MDQMNQNQADYVWDAITSVEDLGRIRMSAMNAFLLDFEAGKREAGTSPGNSHRFLSTRSNSTLPCRLISCFCTAPICQQNFISRPLRKCCAWLWKCGYFHCSHSMATFRRISISLPGILSSKVSASQSSAYRMNSNGAAMKCCVLNEAQPIMPPDLSGKPCNQDLFE